MTYVESLTLKSTTNKEGEGGANRDTTFIMRKH